MIRSERAAPEGGRPIQGGTNDMRTIIGCTAACATALLIAIMALTPGQPTLLWIDKADHAAAFGALALVLSILFRSDRAVLAVACTAAALVEIAQGAMPWLGREMSFADLVFSALGAFAVLCSLRILRMLARTIVPMIVPIPDEA